MQRYDYALTCGVFDVLHKGHVNLLSEMQLRSDNLIVMIHDDLSTFFNKGRFTIQRLTHRIDNLKELYPSCKIYPVYTPNPDFKRVIAQQSGNGVFLRGDDWQDFPSKDQIGIDIEYIPYTKDISTTQIYESNK